MSRSPEEIRSLPDPARTRRDAQAHALLQLPFAALQPRIIAAPIWQDRGRVEPDGSLHVAFGIGAMRLFPQGDHSVLVVECADEAGLQTLRDFITDEAVGIGLTPLWQERHRPGRPANLCIATLEAVERVSPSFRRIWLRGEGLARLLSGGLHFRLLLPPEGVGGAPLGWPRLDESGLTVWPGGAANWHRPVYTVRRIEGEGPATRVAVDVFLHDGGRVTAWTEAVRPGAEVALMGPSGGDIPEGAGGPAPWFGLYGDETALPAIARILAALPPGAVGEAVVAVPQDTDRQDLDHPPGLALRWIIGTGAARLVTALEQAPIPEAGRFVFFAAGSAETARARQVLAARGLGRGEIRAQAYWLSPGGAGGDP